MGDRFPLTEIPGEVSQIASKLLAAGHDTWYVGGAVRDALMRGLQATPHTSHPTPRQGDFDIATSATPDQVVALFRRTVPVGIEHGTVAVLDDQNRGHEVTTFRRDVKTDGRHAEVEFGASLDDDLARRDFTINAIAVHPESGELRDPHDGRRDLAAGLVRAVGDPATRFREDRLRVLRGLRFAAAFGFEIEPATFAAIRASAGDLAHLSRERVRDEWLKMLATAAPELAVGLWANAGVLSGVWPELATLPKTLDGLDQLADEPVLVTAALLFRAGASAGSEAALTRLRFSNKDIASVAGTLKALSQPLPDPGNLVAVRRWVSLNRADALWASRIAGRLADGVAAVLNSGAPLSLRELAVTGEDLAKAGVARGPAMGETLRRLLDAVLEDPSRNTRETLLALAQPATSK